MRNLFFRTVLCFGFCIVQLIPATAKGREYLVNFPFAVLDGSGELIQTQKNTHQPKLDLSKLISIKLIPPVQPCSINSACAVKVQIQNISGKLLEINDPEVTLFLDLGSVDQLDQNGNLPPGMCLAPVDLGTGETIGPAVEQTPLVLRKNEKKQIEMDLSRLAWNSTYHRTKWPNKQFGELVSTGKHTLQFVISKSIHDPIDKDGQVTYWLEKTRVSSNQISLTVTE
ncbi:MAG: hypothetical protein HY774_02950 [Acidobacteria bacterium]|nr:hypothetical protein [Acidobacteriota bacterium]